MSHEDDEGWWGEFEGAELNDSLYSGAIALLDAQWLVDYANDDNNNNTGERPVLSRRQDLPLEAFLSSKEIKEATDFQGLHIICLSYMWLTPTHPDPRGDTLQLLANKLKDIVYDTSSPMRNPRWAVFWDYASLFQHPRTLPEDALFRKGLNSLALFYSHPQTLSYRIREFPRGYPEGYTLPLEGNCAPYENRGWPLVESSLTNLVKPSKRTSNLSWATDSEAIKDAISEKNYDSVMEKIGYERLRPPPYSPESMSQRLQEVSFTNAKDDRPLVMTLYEKEYKRRLAQTSSLSCRSLGWNDSDIKELSKVISDGYCPKLESLDLANNLSPQNSFGPEGCQLLADALMSLDREHYLSDLNLSFVANIGNEGVKALAEVILSKTYEVKLRGVKLSSMGCRALEETSKRILDAKKDVYLQVLDLSDNDIGDDGMEALVGLMIDWPCLKKLDLTCCKVGDQGCRALAEALSNAPPQKKMVIKLERNNGITHVGRELLESATSRTPGFVCWLDIPRRTRGKT